MENLVILIKNGEEVIKCEYDLIPGDVSSFFGSFGKICIIAKKGDTYYTLTTKGKVINTSKENMAPFLKGSFVEKVFKEMHVDYEDSYGTCEYGDVYNESMELYVATMYINIAIKSLSDTTESDNIENESSNNIEDNSLKDKILDIFNNMDNEKFIAENYYKENDNRIYEFKLEDGKLLKVEEIIIDKNEENNIYELDFNVSVWDNDNLINEYKGIQIPWKMYDDSSRREIDSFENGYIPYCDLENKISGVFYKNNFEKAFEIHGNFQILQVIDDNRILLNDYNDLNNIKKIIIDKQGNILLSCKEVEITENGYIVKKDNDKISYLNMEFEEKIHESQYIEIVENGYVVKKDNDKYIYLNNEFEQITQEFDYIEEFYGYDNKNEKIYDLLVYGEKNANMKVGLVKKDGKFLTLSEYDGIGIMVTSMTNQYYDICVEEDLTLDSEREFLLDNIYKSYYNLSE